MRYGREQRKMMGIRLKDLTLSLCESLYLGGRRHYLTKYQVT